MSQRHDRTATQDKDPATAIARQLRAAKADDTPGSKQRANELQWKLAKLGQSVLPFEIRRLRRTAVPISELEQEAMLGLFEAAARFDPERGVRFGTFARWHVRNRLQIHVARTGPVLAQPVSAQRARARIRRALHVLESGGKPRTIQNIAEVAGLPTERVRTLRSPIQGHDFDGPADSRDGRTWAEQIPARPRNLDAALDHQRALRTLQQLLQSSRSPLGERERSIVFQRYLHQGKRAPSRRQVGQKLGISGERVRQLEQRALKRLRKSMQQATAQA